MKPKPELVWDGKEECWMVRVGDYITVRFLPEGEVLVAGSFMAMSISYDHISEESGILFKEEK